MNPAVQHLPPALALLAPELVETDLPSETLADCANCPMAGAPFLPDVRCCTYHPALANFLVGRALRRGDGGSALVRARIARLDGVGPLGVGPPGDWAERYARERDEGFGREASWRCPYWVPGALSCGIWRDRNMVCRSWHCKHVDGVRGHRVWAATRALGTHVETRLAAWCAADRVLPTDATGWEAYYLACAEQVDAASPEALAACMDGELPGLRSALKDARAGLDAPLPDVLAPNVRGVTPRGEDVELVGYTAWHAVTLPRAVFALLAELDGVRPWREAVQRALVGGATVDPDWVRLLWDRDLLQAPPSSAPWGFSSDDLNPEDLATTLAARPVKR